MIVGTTGFAQMMAQIDHNEFHRIVRSHDRSCRKPRLLCWEQFLCMAFAQLTCRESLRDIENCLRSLGGKLYHSGMRSRISRSTPACANEHRRWKIYQDLALSPIARAQTLYRDDQFPEGLDGAVYAFDSTIGSAPPPDTVGLRHTRLVTFAAFFFSKSSTASRLPDEVDKELTT